jgi:hypothetical protein
MISAAAITTDINGRRVIIVGSISGKVKIFDINRKMRLIGIFDAHASVTCFLCMEGKFFISGGIEGLVHIWLWKTISQEEVSKEEPIMIE